MLGSSRMYSTPTSREPICVARRMRCASPPLSVSAERPSVRYSSPTFTRNDSRSRTSLRMGPAMSRDTCGSVSTKWKNSSASATGMATTWPMDRPPMVTARLSGRSRAPWQMPQGRVLMYSSSISRTESLLLSR
jgi:hypothetical protein